MTFTITEITRCAGLNHYRCVVTVNGVQRNIVVTKDDLGLEPDEVEMSFLARIRSAVKEAGAITYAQARTALINKEFQL
jgi:hypothetical protein